MKALILAGGRGSRIDSLSAARNKCMIQVNNRPVLEFSLNAAAATQVDSIVMVVGYRAEEIINHYGTQFGGKRISYVIQWEQKGLVHAIECARETLDGHDFMLLLGDEILLNPRHQAMLDKFDEEDVFALCGILRVEDRSLIQRTYTLIQDDQGQLFRLVEKPRHPLNDLMGTGDCVFKNGIYDYIAHTPLHHSRQEKELPDLIQCAIDDGMRVKSFMICDKYANLNTLDDVGHAESFLDAMN